MRGSRSAPRLWDTDFLLLRPLARLIGEQATAHIRPAALVVDLGCGDMPYATMLRARGFDYRGADLDGGADLAIDRAGRVDLPTGAAGAVLSVQVLEHVADLDAYCAEIRRLLAPDGVLILSTHGAWLYHPHPQDHRRWTRTGLALDLAMRGLEVEACTAIAGPLATTTLIRLAGYAVMLRRVPLIGGVLARAMAVVMNLRAMAEDAVTPATIRDDNACVYLVRARVSRTALATAA